MSIVHSEALPYLQGLPEASIDLIVTDPPYGIKKDPTWDCWPSDTAYLAWLAPHLLAMRRVLKPNGSLYLFAAPQMAARVEVLVGEVFHVLNQIVWEKSTGNANWRADKEAVRAYLPNTERIIFAEQYGDQYADAAQALHKQVFAPLGRYIQQERERAGCSQNEVDVALGYTEKKNPERGSRLIQRWEEGSSLPTREAYERLQYYLNTRNGRTDYLRQEYEDLRRPFTLTPHIPYTDVWRFRPVVPEPGKHICEKPLALLKHIIETSSREGALVVDCFCGSGSSLDAARQLNRQYMGCDADENWVRRAQQRLATPYTMALFAHEVAHA